jgi:glutamine amidotransferase
MCRMLGYVGAAVPLAELLTRPRHSLLVQSYRPREMTSGTVNADGFGAALWLDDGKPEPAIYRTAAPIWADPNLGWMGDRLRATALLAAVRSATPGIGYELSNVQPFARGPIAFVHNGFIKGFRHGPQRALREGLGEAAYEAVAGTSDSEHLFALVLDELDRGPREEVAPDPAALLAAALKAALVRLRRVCEAHGTPAVAALILSDGASLVACRWSYGVPPASLYAAAMGPGGRAVDPRGIGDQGLAFCVASEPLDSQEGEKAAGWLLLEAQQLITLRPGSALRAEALP